MSTDTKMVSRRRILQRAAVAGTVVWAAPIVSSSTAHAVGGSNGARVAGPLSSVTCAWDRAFFRPNRGTPSAAEHDYAGETFCEIDVGTGWQRLSFGGTFTVTPPGVVQMRPATGHSGGRTAEPGGADTATDTDTEATDTTVASTTTEPPTTTPLPPAPEVPADVSSTDAPSESTTTTDPVVDEPLDPLGTDESPADGDVDYVDTIVIDMTGRTPINVGDAYGYFTVVDAEPA